MLCGWLGSGFRHSVPDLLNMMDSYKAVKVFPVVAMGAAAFLVYLSLRRPYLFDTSHLIGLIGLVAAGFIASQYRTHFWTLMIAVFFWAGSDVPLNGPMNLFR